MSDSSASKFPTLLFGGIISIVVGIASGYGVNWLSEKKAELTYDVTSIQAFPGQERIGIVAVRISNTGSRELENIDATVRFSDAEVKEILFQGLTPQTTNKEKGGVRFQIPFLNPAENFSVQILVSPTAQALQQPSVDLRAKGAVGIPINRDVSEKELSMKNLWSLLASAAATIMALSAAVVIRAKTSRISVIETANAIASMGNRHSGDQRDVFAYVLGLCGLSVDANFIRAWPRDLSYWSISDILADRWIEANDEKVIRSGISALTELIDYAEIHPSSGRIIQLNISRLYLALNDAPSAKRYLNLANAEGDKVIAKRVALNPTLQELSRTNA